MSADDGCRTVVVIVDGTDEVVIGHLVVGLRCDLVLVEALARVQLEAGRVGCSIRLRDPSPELCELLALVGLGDLVG